MEGKRNVFTEAWIRTSLDSKGYEMKQFIGTGGFGRVYLVRNQQTGRLAACKCASELQSQKLLQKEAGFLRQIHHPVFPAFEMFLEGQKGSLLLMEYVEGESLAERLGRGDLSTKQAIDYAVRLAEGLRYLHELSEPVLYRDLKPEHVKVSRDGEVKLLDLGCACRLTEVRFSKAGTRGYAPPEQLAEGQPGVYSDVYAFGKLLHYMLTGDNPYLASTQKSGVQIHGKQISPYLRIFIEHCTKADYRERIQDMNSVMLNLSKCGREENFLYERIVK